MKSHSDDYNVRNSGHLTKFTCLAAGLVVGALVSTWLASQSGDETRKWIATKWKGGVKAVNEKVRQTHQQMKDSRDQKRQQVSEAISAR